MIPSSKSQSFKMGAVFLCLCMVAIFQGCGAFRIHNRDQTVLGAHQVVITPCGWKLEDKFSGTVKDEQTGKSYYKYSCGETVLTIKDEELAVNGRSYGKLANETDSLKIDHGRVLINGREVQEVASR